MMLQRSALRPVGGARASRARNVSVRAADRPLWAPGVVAPAHLNGTLPGDYGGWRALRIVPPGIALRACPSRPNPPIGSQLTRPYHLARRLGSAGPRR